jgi:small-conductance mechanosensitive channel
MNLEQFREYFSKIIEQFNENLVTFLPKLVSAFFVLFIGFLISRFFRWLMERLAKNLDRIITNEKIKSKFRQLKLERYTRLLSKILYWMFIFLFLTIATEILGLPIISSWLTKIVEYLPNLFAAALIIFLAIISGKLLRDFITTTADDAGILYSAFLGNVVYYLLLLTSLIVALDQIGIDIGILTILINIILGAVLLGAAIAFALGARTSISNILASYYLQNTYHEGQIIKIGDIKGKITKITATAVIIETEEGQVSVPAKDFSEDVTILLKKEKL